MLNGHLASEHVQLGVQLCTRARGVTLIIPRGLTYSELVWCNLAYAKAILLASKEECQLGRAYLAAIKCIATLSTNAGVSDMAFFVGLWLYVAFWCFQRHWQWSRVRVFLSSNTAIDSL